MNDDLLIREARVEDGDAINGLFRDVFQKERSLSTWKWLYHETPGGPGHAVIAIHNDTIIGHAGTIRRRVQVGEHSLIAGQSIDAMTHPQHQKKGINQRLNEALSELHQEKDVALVYGFSNRHSTPGVIQHQNRVPLAPFPVMVRPLRWFRLPLRALQRRERNPAPQPIEFPSGLDQLWQSNREIHEINMVRDHAYFGWRYARPKGSYRTVQIRQGGVLNGFAVLAFRTQMGLLTGFVTDVVVREDKPEHWDELMNGLMTTAQESDCDMISALAFESTSAHAAFRRAGLRFVPEKLNPEDIVFSVRDNQSQNRIQPLTKPSTWHLCWGEHDLL